MNQHAAIQWCVFLKHKHSKSKPSTKKKSKTFTWQLGWLSWMWGSYLPWGSHYCRLSLLPWVPLYLHLQGRSKKKKRREHLTAQYTKGYNKCNLIRKHFLWLPLSLVNFWNDFLNSAGIVVRHYSRHLLSDSSILKTLRTFLPFK